MKISHAAIAISATYFLSACGNAEHTQPAAEKEEIGSTLNEKVDVSIEDTPEAVLAAARAAIPDVTFTEAEREIRNGVIYYDVGGVTPEGDEIELDIMQDGDGWKVVEIQRDISFDDTPQAVKEALLENAPNVEPARIIESDQGDGVVIYEFYTVAANGEEEKYEVKLEGGQATFLTEEWVH